MQNTFSLEDRAQLRATLLRYMKDHDIGVPTLQFRIAKSAKRNASDIPIKTLQRFLSGGFRTQDWGLIWYAAFAATLPPPKTAIKEWTAAAGLQDLNRNSLDQGTAGDSLALLRGAWAVNKALWIRDEIVGPYSYCEFASAADSRAVLVREEIVSPDNTDSSGDGASGPKQIYQGIALSFAPLILILSKSALTGLPCTYWLRDSNNGQELAGHRIAAELIFDSNIVQPYSHPGRYRFMRTERGAAP